MVLIYLDAEICRRYLYKTYTLTADLKTPLRASRELKQN